MGLNHVVLLLPELEEIAQQHNLFQQYAPQLWETLALGGNTGIKPDWIPELSSQAPLAAYARCLDADDVCDLHWLRADPVVMQADINRVHLLAVNRHGLTVAQADRLLLDLQPLFAGEGLCLSRGQAEGAHERWYVSAEQQLPVGFSPPDAALGNPLEDFLGNSSGSILWRRIQAETQMQLHQHPINQERHAIGLQPLNSLWFWGGGALPEKKPMQLPDAVWAASPELAGWSHWLKIDEYGYATQAAAADWLKMSAPPTVKRLLIEFRLQRQFSLEQNLMDLNRLTIGLTRLQANLQLSLCGAGSKALKISKPGLLKRLVQSTKAARRQAMQSLSELNQ